VPRNNYASEQALIEALSSDKDIFEVEKLDCTISPMAKNLLRKMLEKDPAKRASAEEALHHPWFMVAKTFVKDKDGRRKAYLRAQSHIINSTISEERKDVPLQSSNSKPKVDTYTELNDFPKADSLLLVPTVKQFFKGSLEAPRLMMEQRSAASLRDFDDMIPVSEPSLNEVGSLAKGGPKITKTDSLQAVDMPYTPKSLEVMRIFLYTPNEINSELLDALSYNRPYLENINRMAQEKPQSLQNFEGSG
jgi:serine/threonine protein kinase